MTTTDDLQRALTALSEDLTAGQWIPHRSERELASHIAIGLQTPAGEKPENLHDVVRAAFHVVGPNVATPSMTNGCWAATTLRCAAVLEPARVANSDEGHLVAAQVLNLCVEVAAR
ncbi:hypothetical protein [Streptomyces violascens]|uniref:hypothetical protein n=1 Tax=Streptomyces violascens TaxID=67381 RepID=UPI00167260A4|nr:hypothetical protein [Streptomyces violascens]